MNQDYYITCLCCACMYSNV